MNDTYLDETVHDIDLRLLLAEPLEITSTVGLGIELSAPKLHNIDYTS